MEPIGTKGKSSIATESTVENSPMAMFLMFKNAALFHPEFCFHVQRGN